MCKFCCYFISFFCLLCCTNKNKKQQSIDISSIREINVSSDITREEISDIIELDSYIPLSNDVVIGNIERVIIYNDHIYILDDEPKLLCFNMNGEVVFKICSRGAGPDEYQNIKDFAVDGKSKRIIAFDNEKRKLFFYKLENGKYISSTPTLYMAPTEFGVADGSLFFKNIDNRFAVQENHPFYLLYSENGSRIDGTFLPHDAVADFNFDMNSFFYNRNDLLFVRPFDNVVYALKKNKVAPVYKINLPNQLPLSVIEEKSIKHVNIPASGYSYGIDRVYMAGNTFHFTYDKDGFIVSVFIDMLTNTFLYNGIRVLGNARENFPVYSLIDGVYEDKFFALVPALSIVESRTVSPEFFQGKLLKLKEEDNDVLVFFTMK